MIQFGFRVDEALAKAFDTYAAPRGGRSQAIRDLMVAALAQGGVTLPEPPLKASQSHGNWAGILVKLDPAEYELLDQHTGPTRMSRGQWIVALVRRRLKGSRQFNAFDRKRLAAVFQDMRKVEGHIGRASQAVREGVELGRPLELHLALLTKFESRIVRMGHALRAAYLGNDRYWDDLLNDKLTDIDPALPEMGPVASRPDREKGDGPETPATDRVLT